MRIGITVGLGARAESTIDGLAQRLRDFEQRGFNTAWMANAFGFDAITALAAAGSQTHTMELGTAVVPTYPRHPVVMAQQALTAQSATNGRFTLGIGVSHRVMISDSLGIDFERPAAHTREYLTVLGPLLEGQPATHAGKAYNVNARVSAPTDPRVPVLVAAMGPVMLSIAGELASGTITSWVGPRTLDSHIVPTIVKAAAAASRPIPRIVAGLPIAITSEPSAARERFAPQVASYNALPSYRSMLDIEGVDDPAAVALFGGESELDAALERLASAGATDFAAQVVSVEPGATARTIDYLASRLALAD